MPRLKRSSRILSSAELRIASLRSIGDNLNLGNGLTLTEYATRIEDLRTKLADYNQALSTVDRAVASVEAAEAELKNLSELMLMGVATKFGKDSYEYEMAGGVRKSERKRPTRKVSAAA